MIRLSWGLNPVTFKKVDTHLQHVVGDHRYIIKIQSWMMDQRDWVLSNFEKDLQFVWLPEVMSFLLDESCLQDYLLPYLGPACLLLQFQFQISDLTAFYSILQIPAQLV